MRAIGGRILARGPRLALVFLCSIAVLAFPDWAMAVDCNVELHGAIGAKNSDANGTWASKAEVWVNDFAGDQYASWRAVAIFENGTNFVEVGWTVGGPSGDQQPHPYKTIVSDGIQHSVTFSLINPSDDTFHTFTVKDPDDDNDYVFLYDNQTLGVPSHASIHAPDARAVTQSERLCYSPSDSLFAKFRDLKYMRTEQGAIVDWPDHVNAPNAVADPYTYCRFGGQGYDVKQSC